VREYQVHLPTHFAHCMERAAPHGKAILDCRITEGTE
jgi:hypothetical protein